jgi:hypothetical protein
MGEKRKLFFHFWSKRGRKQKEEGHFWTKRVPPVYGWALFTHPKWDSFAARKPDTIGILIL